MKSQSSNESNCCGTRCYEIIPKELNTFLQPKHPRAAQLCAFPHPFQGQRQRNRAPGLIGTTAGVPQQELHPDASSGRRRIRTRMIEAKVQEAVYKMKIVFWSWFGLWLIKLLAFCKLCESNFNILQLLIINNVYF